MIRQIRINHTVLIAIVALLVVLAGCVGSIDVDGDGLNKSVEDYHDLNEFEADTDSDGLNDSFELNHENLSPKKSDTDGDGLIDKHELQNGTDPSKEDTDADGLTDSKELHHSTDPIDPDTDGDGVEDGTEIQHSASPKDPDTDGDGVRDKREIQSDSLRVNNPDTDDDGLSDGEELELPTQPHIADSDDDGRPDEVEVNSETDPLDSDTDGDGLEDGVEAPPGEPIRSDPTHPDTDGDGLNDRIEYEIDTDPTSKDTDSDGRPDLQEYESGDLDPTDREVDVIKNSPRAGLSNSTLRNETLSVVEFLSDLPQNRSKRDKLVTDTATKICTTHNEVVSRTAANATGISEETYRNTYRVAHTAQVLHSSLGADIDVKLVEDRMAMARRYSGVASKYAPVFGSYNRLHEASCAVKRGEPGAKEDFYVAAATFTVDVALVQQQVAYNAAFKTTGFIAREVGLTRLARVCGYKCVGLVESELHWALRGTYHGSLGYLTEEAVTGDLTTTGYDEAAEHRVADYLEQHDLTVVEGVVTNATTVTECFKSNIEVTDLPKLAGEVKNIAQYWILNQDLPNDVDLHLLTDAEDVKQCVTETE